MILPVTMPLVDYCEGGIAGRFSPYIIPVFLGLTMVKQTLLPEEVAYYKKYEPIGCRDERTLHTLRKYNIQCYLHGCVTITLPKRERLPEHPKTYVVDINGVFFEQIPKRLLQDAQFRTHLRKEELDNPKIEALKQYQEYIDDAGLVITSLLHCSIPCVAAGIPVIMLKEKISYRMAWLERVLPIYTKETITKIDWNPMPVNIAEHKKRVMDITISRLINAYDKNAELYDLSWFYENRSRNTYVNDACYSLKQFIDENWKDLQKEYLYSIWGLTQMSEWLIDYIEKHYPNARLCHVYDSFRKIKLCGLLSENPENIVKSPMETVFVTTNGAEEPARKLFKKIKKPKDTYAFLQIIN